ncbi:hypothetical protein MtrunA17_Chr1g0196351 [Medicago truncatula]|uniref:Uncharacterized protein n=1 Tax=Medicago truncatula TaxID=3880 RepID=A0A396JYL0_MEDTR|nr:hypothetical protein MtrunA17_Chr1g0196351 [Medicago truncatula]
MWKMIYYLQVIQNDGDVASMFRLMVENYKLYLCVRFNYVCPNCQYRFDVIL